MTTIYVKAFTIFFLLISSLFTHGQMVSFTGQWVSDAPILLDNHAIKAIMFNGLDESSDDLKWNREGVMCDQFDDADHWMQPSSFRYFVENNRIGIRFTYSSAGISEDSEIMLKYRLMSPETLIVTFGNQTAVYKRKYVEREMRI